ncbi:MAG: type II and III secretion system protein family protein, partial [Alphaproteobacteria bacterium]
MIKRLILLTALVFSSLSLDALAAAPPLNISVDHGTSLTLSAPASSVFIANPEIADVQVMSPTSIMVFGKRTGETTFMATDVNGNTLSQRTVVVMQDLTNLRQELNAAIPGNKIQAQTLPNGIVLTGEAKDPSSVADAYRLAQRYLANGGDIINRIRVVGSNQIHIRVRFAEVKRNIDNTIGINWNALASVGGFAFGLFTGPDFLGADRRSVTRTNNSTLALPNNAIVAGKTGGHYNVAGMIDALAQDGLLTILAEPNLTAMSGETASFLAGGEFPIPIPQGNGAISIQFKKYGISLEFTPTLISENRINLHVKPEVSQLTSAGSIVLNNISVPALTTRKAETTVEVGSGESFAMAGLLDNSQAQTVNKYPLLGDLPILGALFRSDHFVQGQTELVVIITPYIVKPNGEQILALPTDGMAPPSEMERLVGLRNTSGDPNVRLKSGTPVAKQIEPPVAEITPVTVPVIDAASVPPTEDAYIAPASLPS